MANQLSTLGFSNSAAYITGYALRTNETFGKVDFTFENTGTNAVVLQLRELVGSGTGAAYSYNLGPQFTVQAGGVVDQSLVILSQQIGIFGSGQTTVNMAINRRNMGDRRHPEIEIIPVGKQNWGYSPGFNINDYSGNYGTTPLG